MRATLVAFVSPRPSLTRAISAWIDGDVPECPPKHATITAPILIPPAPVCIAICANNKFAHVRKIVHVAQTNLEKRS